MPDPVKSMFSLILVIKYEPQNPHINSHIHHHHTKRIGMCPCFLKSLSPPSWSQSLASLKVMPARDAGAPIMLSSHMTVADHAPSKNAPK